MPGKKSKGKIFNDDPKKKSEYETKKATKASGKKKKGR